MDAIENLVTIQGTWWELPILNTTSEVKVSDGIPYDLITAKHKRNEIFIAFVKKQLQASEVFISLNPNRTLQTFGNLVKS